MEDIKFLMNHGFTEDEDKKVLSKLFITNKKFKQVDISVNLTEPFMLLARSKEKNVIVKINSIQENRLILKKGDRCGTIIMNILLDEISNCMFKDYGNGLFKFEFEMCNFRYSLHVMV